ncbi:MAG: SdrD B-like domain-containing protein [Mastigocoleus sp. MO_167.B18]|nr:SdrD B-like domain-containing protein [Mastigocoleus sp. MO_167.B18]
MKALLEHLLAQSNNRGHDYDRCASKNHLPTRYDKISTKVSVNQKYSFPFLLSPSQTQHMLRGMMKPLGSSFLTLIFTVPQLIFGGDLLSDNRVLAQTTSCPAGTTPRILNWSPTNNRAEIESQRLNTNGVITTFEFTESIRGQVIDNEETRITSGVYGGQPGPNLEFNIGRRPPGQQEDRPAPPNSNATLIINFSQPVQVEPLLLLDVDRDGERDEGFTFQDQVTVRALNGDTNVGVSLRAISPDNVRVQNNVATGVGENAPRENALQSSTGVILPTIGNVETTISGPVNQIRIQYTAAIENGDPRQDETIGLARLNLCVGSGSGPGSIGDTVFNDINGDGIQNRDAGELGIPNATVTLTLPERENQLRTRTTNNPVSIEARTDENGLYRFEVLPPGPYRVTLTPPDNFPQITTGSSQRTVNLLLGQNADDVDFGLRSGVVGEENPTNLRLVKRITGVFGSNGQLIGSFNTFEDGTGNADNVLNEALNKRLFGVLEFPTKSGDVVEYTIYFLAEGGAPQQNVRICDLIPQGTSFSQNTFGVGKGISLQQGNASETSLTNTEDTDVGAFYSPLKPFPSNENACQNQNNPNGAVIVNINEILPDNFGSIRFRVKID